MQYEVSVTPACGDVVTYCHQRLDARYPGVYLSLDGECLSRQPTVSLVNAARIEFFLGQGRCSGADAARSARLFGCPVPKLIICRHDGHITIEGVTEAGEEAAAWLSALPFWRHKVSQRMEASQ